jgi:hypothetical protein
MCLATSHYIRIHMQQVINRMLCTMALNPVLGAVYTDFVSYVEVG